MKQKLSRHDRAGSGSRFVTHQEMRRGCAVKAGEDGLAMTIMTIMLSRSWAPPCLARNSPYYVSKRKLCFRWRHNRCRKRFIKIRIDVGR